MSNNGNRNQTVGEDALSKYLRDISSLPLLRREEEIELTRLVQQGDERALHRLVEGNLRFVVHMAVKYTNSRIPLIDLINEGNIGLIKAAEKFNPDKGVKFITYAVWWIMASIKSALAKQTGVIAAPLKHTQVVSKINRKKIELSRQLEREPSLEELAEALDLTSKDIEANLLVTHAHLSLDDSITDEPSLSYLNAIKTNFDVDENLDGEELRGEIATLLMTLSGREQDIVSMRFGINGYEPMTLREIGEIMGLSKERVRQIEAGALEHLQTLAKARNLEVFLN